jgi:hypothetical protein
VVCVDADFAHKGRRGEELHFDAPFGYEVVGGGEAGEREEDGSREDRGAHCSAGMRCAGGVAAEVCGGRRRRGEVGLVQEGGVDDGGP